MPKLTLEERRRETLRRQLYGKEESATRSKSSKVESGKANTNSTKTFALPNYSASSIPNQAISESYLTRDLSKILIFSVLAIGVQFSLYFLLQTNLVKLPF